MSRRRPGGQGRRPVLSSPAAWQLLAALRAVGLWVRRRLGQLTRRVLPHEAQHLFALTLAVGALCGVAAVAFHLAIEAAEGALIAPALRAAHGGSYAWLVVTPTLGGLLGGLLLRYVAPGARGSGIPQIKAALARPNGRIGVRDALGKFGITTLQIGAGASLGREGPTAQICAGIAGLVARLAALPPARARRLLPVGVAAGIAAAFNAPIAAVTFAVEEIVGGLDHTVLSGVVIAAALAAAVERSVLGAHPVIETVQTAGLGDAASLGSCALLGALAAPVSIAFTDGLLALRAAFRRSRLPTWAQPGVGGLVTGLLAVAAVATLGEDGVVGGGVVSLRHALAGSLTLEALLLLGAAKLTATVFSYASGGAGGIFAPSLCIGAMLGGAVGSLDVLWLGHDGSQLGAFALVGMGAVFAGVVRVPITSVMIIVEMTGSYGLVLPLMLANMVAYSLARHWRPVPIYDALLAQDGIAVPHAAPAAEARPDLRVGTATTTAVVTAQADEDVAAARVRLGARQVARLPVVDGGGTRVLGWVAAADLAAGGDRPRRVAEQMALAPQISTAAPLGQAVAKMHAHGVRQLVVVDAATEARLVGMVAISDVVRLLAATAAATVRAVPRATPGGTPAPAEAATPGADFAKIPVRTAWVPLTAVAAATTLVELSRQLRGATDGVFWVLPGPGSAGDGGPGRGEGDRGGDGGRAGGIIVAEQVRALGRQGGASEVLVAGDLARPAPVVGADAGLGAALAAMDAAGAPAALVVDAAGTPIAALTRAGLAAACLGWYRVNAAAAAPPPG